jgi:molybdopterin-guanine dinucleotide biosynthesis protein A
MTLIAPLNGLVLAGGRSSRMGEPKAWLSFSGLPQWQACEKVLAPLCKDVFFSVSNQLSRPLPVAAHRLVKDSDEPCGPLGAIICGFKERPEHAMFVLACDMPNFDLAAASFLKDHRNSQSLATVFLDAAGGIEPLCTIYEPRIFEILLKFWSKKIYCPRKILGELAIERVIPKNYSWLTNINKREDMATKRVELHFYAGLREEAQCSSLQVHTKALSVADLYAEMQIRFKFSLNQKSLRFAKNQELVEGRASLSDGDTIVFIPPVSGG